MVIREALLRAQSILKSTCAEGSRLDAQVLLMHVLGQDRAFLLLHQDDALSPAQEAAFFDAVEKRAAHMPVAYLTGQREFMSLDFRVAEGVLIPRPDTETLVELVIDELRDVPSPRVADVGTGSGAIAVSLAYYVSGCRVDAMDVSDVALEIAAENARRILGGDRVNVRRFDMLRDELLPGDSYDAVVSNPPYIRQADMAELMPDVLDYEPHLALCGGVDGLVFYRAILQRFSPHLKSGGRLAFEIGHDMAQEVADLIRAHGGYANIRTVRDLAGRTRCVLAQRE